MSPVSSDALSILVQIYGFLDQRSPSTNFSISSKPGLTSRQSGCYVFFLHFLHLPFSFLKYLNTHLHLLSLKISFLEQVTHLPSSVLMAFFFLHLHSPVCFLNFWPSGQTMHCFLNFLAAFTHRHFPFLTSSFGPHFWHLPLIFSNPGRHWKRSFFLPSLTPSGISLELGPQMLSFSTHFFFFKRT